MRKIIVLFSITLLTLIGCTEPKITETVEEDNDGRVVAEIHGVVKNLNLQTPLNDCTVKYQRNGNIKTTSSDDDGYYRIENLNAGTYELTFIKDDFVRHTAVKVIPSIDDLNADGINVGNEDYEITLNLDAELHELNSAIKGKFWYITDEEIMGLAPNVSIVVRVHNTRNEDSPFPNQAFTVECNADGEFLLEDLPAFDDMIFSTEKYQIEVNGENFIYSPLQFNLSLDYGEVTDLGNLYLNEDLIIDDSVYIVQTNFENLLFPIEENLISVFSHPVNTDTFIAELKDFNDSTVPMNVTWDENKLKVTMNPTENLQANSDYSLQLQGNTENGTEFDFSFDLTTE